MRLLELDWFTEGFSLGLLVFRLLTEFNEFITLIFPGFADQLVYMLPLYERMSLFRNTEVSLGSQLCSPLQVSCKVLHCLPLSAAIVMYTYVMNYEVNSVSVFDRRPLDRASPPLPTRHLAVHPRHSDQPNTCTCQQR